MPYFTVNTNAQPISGDHEVHDLASTRGCLPSVENRTDLGEFASCREAVEAAKSQYSKVNGCFWCAIACHTT
ncbi:MAG: hypothetical protein ACOH14_01170 [Rhodoglobus sp.]